jgi:hypothetical protein
MKVAIGPLAGDLHRGLEPERPVGRIDQGECARLISNWPGENSWLAAVTQSGVA